MFNYSERVDKMNTRDVTDAILAEIDGRREEYGLRISPPDASRRALIQLDSIPVTISRGAQSEEKVLAYLPNLTSDQQRRMLGEYDGGRALLFGPRVHQRAAEVFRRNGVNFLDAQGNAFITFGDVWIDIRGRTSVPASRLIEKLAPQAEMTPDLFTNKRARVIFAFLQWPEITSWPMREIARIAGVSVGQVQSSMAELMNAGYLRSDNRHLRNESSLFRRFVAEFSRTIGAPARGQIFLGDLNRPLAHPDGDLVPVVSGESALPRLIRPETAIYYAEKVTPELLVANRWRPSLTGNVTVRPRFWREPFPPEHMKIAPSILVYSDLIASNDGRQAAVAEEYRAHDPRLREL